MKSISNWQLRALLLPPGGKERSSPARPKGASTRGQLGGRGHKRQKGAPEVASLLYGNTIEIYSPKFLYARFLAFQD